jgi:hypothetical protein
VPRSHILHGFWKSVGEGRHAKRVSALYDAAAPDGLSKLVRGREY